MARVFSVWKNVVGKSLVDKKGPESEMPFTEVRNLDFSPVGHVRQRSF